MSVLGTETISIGLLVFSCHQTSRKMLKNESASVKWQRDN